MGAHRAERAEVSAESAAEGMPTGRCDGEGHVDGREGDTNAVAREIVDHCPRCSRLLSRPDSDARNVYECPGCGRWWQINPLTTFEAIAKALACPK